MRLEGWAEYLPPPGSRYTVVYRAENALRSGEPDLNAFERSLDRRSGVNVRSVAYTPSSRTNPGGLISADIEIFLGDTPMVTAIGNYHSDGEDFWMVHTVDRNDGNVPKTPIGVRQVLDAALDPIQDIFSAGKQAVVETTHTVAKVGVPSFGIVAAAVIAFLVFYRR